jgi:hypothetical protein
MKTNITEIYRIETMNSTYEIKVVEKDGKIASLCKKMGLDQEKHQVKANGTEYLDRLFIGASFKVPGVVTTSVVTDYSHFVLSTKPKARVTGPDEHLLTPVVEAIKEQLNPTAVMLDDRAAVEICGIDGCQVERVPGLPRHEGFPGCKSGSIASGGARSHCSCDYCY